MDQLRSPDYVRSLLAEEVQAAGGQRKWAARAGVSAVYVGDCLAGRRNIGQSISQVLGYEPVMMYAPIRNKRKKGHNHGTAVRGDNETNKHKRDQRVGN